MRKLGIREAVRLAEGHALGILESTDDDSFWGEDFFYNVLGLGVDPRDWPTLTKAKNIVLSRLHSKAGER